MTGPILSNDPVIFITGKHFPPRGLVLVIDDEPIMQKICVRVLNDAGFNVIVAEDGEQGLHVFSLFHEQILLVVLDMVLPKKSGKDVFIAMKKINTALRVLLNSGFKEDERVREVMKLGVKHFIEKPYSFAQLEEAVEKALRD